MVVVNESFANRNYPGRSPLGERLRFERLNKGGYWYTIVGVVQEIRERGVAEDLRPAIYRVHEQADQTNDWPSGIVVRTAVEPASIVPAIRQAIWSVDKNQPLARIRTMEDIVDRQLSTPTQSTALLGAFALLALLLASVGLYGVLSYAVMQRTNEIGVRMALGATSSEILLSFGKRGLALTLAGLAIGLVLSAIASRLMTALLYGSRPDYIPTVSAVSHSPYRCGSGVSCSRAACVARRSGGCAPEWIEAAPDIFSRSTNGYPIGLIPRSHSTGRFASREACRSTAHSTIQSLCCSASTSTCSTRHVRPSSVAMTWVCRMFRASGSRRTPS